MLCYLNNVESKCIELDKSEWLSSIPLKPKLRTYKNYKMEMKIEDYVKYCLNRKRRSIISQFRIGILPLHIETGRFRNVNEYERKYHICNNEDIENKFHFLCVCNGYIEFRNVLYNIYNVYHNVYNMTDQDIFVYLII